ncbi:MAG: aminopeptidase P family N-terminal domain-containing protein, partial [Candidatus Puniceispirillales bacterium]
MTTLTAPPRGFTEAEFERRCSAAQQIMLEQNLDAMLFASEPEMRYFTGFMTPFWQSPTRPWFLVLPRSGKPVAVIPTIGVPLMGSCYVGDIKSWASPAASDDGISLLSDVIRSYVPNEGRLGLLMGRETVFRAPLADILALKAGLAPRQWIDVTSSIQHIRMIKSPAEIAKISHICAIVSHVFSDLPSWLTTGIPLA